MTLPDSWIDVRADLSNVIESVEEAGFLVAEDSFDGLLDIAQKILARRYPADIFPTLHQDDPERDAGVRLVAAVRAVLEACDGRS